MLSVGQVPGVGIQDQVEKLADMKSLFVSSGGGPCCLGDRSTSPNCHKDLEGGRVLAAQRRREGFPGGMSEQRPEEQGRAREVSEGF